MVLAIKNPPASAGDVRDMGSTLGWKDPLEEGMATHSNILAWRIPQTDENGGLHSTGSQRVGLDSGDLACTRCLTQTQSRSATN